MTCLGKRHANLATMIGFVRDQIAQKSRRVRLKTFNLTRFDSFLKQGRY